MIDVKISFLPMALQNYMAKHMATKSARNKSQCVPLTTRIRSTALPDTHTLAIREASSKLKSCSTFGMSQVIMSTTLAHDMDNPPSIRMFGNVQRICKSFDKSQYKHVIVENKPFFGKRLSQCICWPSALLDCGCMFV